jgi:hypothetical protein
MPPKTQTTSPLDEFERTLKRLNDSYWLLRASASLASKTQPQTAKLTSLLPKEIASHIDVTVQALIAAVPIAERDARYAMLVQAVTAYEEYIGKVLAAFVAKTVKAAKQYTVKLRLADLPAKLTLADLQQVIVASEVKFVVDAKYSVRTAKISKLLIDHGAPAPKIGAAASDLLAEACEARNCVVHSAGIADARAVSELSKTFPHLKVGSPLDLDEAALWGLLGAVRTGVEAIHSALNPPPRPASGRAASRKKSWNPGTRHPTRPQSK